MSPNHTSSRFQPHLELLEGRVCLSATELLPTALVEAAQPEAAEVQPTDSFSINFAKIEIPPGADAPLTGQNGNDLLIVNNGDGPDSQKPEPSSLGSGATGEAAIIVPPDIFVSSYQSSGSAGG